MSRRLAAVILALITLCCGCAAPETVDGVLTDGVRVIELEKDFSTVSVHRGETVRLVLEDEGVLTLSVPELDAEVEGTGEVAVEFKAKTAGEYEIVAESERETRTGTLVVSEFEKQGVYQTVDAAAFEAAMTGNYLLLDVRTQAEYDAGYIQGATLIPLSELADRMDETDGYDRVLVYCASGNRSVTASQLLVDAGHDEVYNLDGGFSAWQRYKQG